MVNFVFIEGDRSSTCRQLGDWHEGKISNISDDNAFRKAFSSLLIDFAFMSVTPWNDRHPVNPVGHPLHHVFFELILTSRRSPHGVTNNQIKVMKMPSWRHCHHIGLILPSCCHLTVGHPLKGTICQCHPCRVTNLSVTTLKLNLPMKAKWKWSDESAFIKAISPSWRHFHHFTSILPSWTILTSM